VVESELKKVVARAVEQAFKALGDFVEPGVITLSPATGFDWSTQEPDTAPEVVNCKVVLVDEKLEHSRDSTIKRYALLKTEKMLPHFTELSVAGRRYRLGTPILSYRFIVLAEAHEIQ